MKVIIKNFNIIVYASKCWQLISFANRKNEVISNNVLVSYEIIILKLNINANLLTMFVNKFALILRAIRVQNICITNVDNFFFRS
jgi:hypothetical protein